MSRSRTSPLPDGLEVRPVLPEHHRAIWNADEEAFRDHWDHAVVTEDDFVKFFGDPDIDTVAVAGRLGRRRGRRAGDQRHLPARERAERDQGRLARQRGDAAAVAPARRRGRAHRPVPRGPPRARDGRGGPRRGHGEPERRARAVRVVRVPARSGRGCSCASPSRAEPAPAPSGAGLEGEVLSARLFPATSSIPCRILTRYQRASASRRTGSMEIVPVALS